MTSSLFASLVAQDTEALEDAWLTITAASCPHQYNFHMHTVYSDGQLTPERVVDQAIAIGLKGFAITDHHSVKGYYAAQSYLDTKKAEDHSLPHLWTGIEINGTLLDTGVHILGYGFDPQHSALEAYRQRQIPEGEVAQAERVIQAIHQAGGFAVLAHPVRYRRSAYELVPAAVECGIDGIEAYYAYDNPQPWVPSKKHTPRMEALGKKHDLWLTCGTDTHGLNLCHRL